MLSYNKLCTLFYEADDKQFPSGALDYYRSALREADGPVLEVMSGSGRLLIPFLIEGFDVDGVDASPSMLAVARDKSKAAGLSPVMVEARLDEMAMARTYKLALCVAGSMSLVTDRSEFRRIMTNILAHLDPGGRFLMEIFTPSGAIKKNNEVFGRWVDLDETRRILLTIVIQYDRKTRTSRMIDKYELFDGSKLVDTELEIIDQRYWDIDELTEELLEAGFASARALKPFRDELAPPDEPLVVFDCLK